jgi:hypothetical protein
MKPRAQRPKNEEEWNDETLDYWVKQKTSWILSDYSILILLNLSHFDTRLKFELCHLTFY